jgi:hypothetical protein
MPRGGAPDLTLAEVPFSSSAYGNHVVVPTLVAARRLAPTRTTTGPSDSGLLVCGSSDMPCPPDSRFTAGEAGGETQYRTARPAKSAA